MVKRKVETICVDTNVVLRFLLDSNSHFHQEAKALFTRAAQGEIRIYLDEIISVEVVWVLIKLYKIKKLDALMAMAKLLKSRYIVNPRKKWMMKAIILSSRTSLSYPDAWLYIISAESGFEVKTFDLDLMRMKREK